MKNVFVRCGGDGGFYIPPAARPGQNHLAYHRSMIPPRPLAASSRSQPVRSLIPSAPRVTERGADNQHVVTPSRAYGRRRYNTLDLASKVVCHGNSLFPLDSLGFRGRMDAELRVRQFGNGPGNAKNLHLPLVSMSERWRLFAARRFLFLPGRHRWAEGRNCAVLRRTETKSNVSSAVALQFFTTEKAP